MGRCCLSYHNNFKQKCDFENSRIQKVEFYEKLNFFICFYHACNECNVSVFYNNEFVLKLPFVCCMYQKRRLHWCKVRERKQLPECVDKMTQLDNSHHDTRFRNMVEMSLSTLYRITMKERNHMGMWYFEIHESSRSVGSNAE